VGIISTVPGGYAVMSGTSMATPAVTGAAARLLGARADIRSQTRDAARAAAFAQALAASARSLGFAPLYVGRGMPQ
jgi:subtilisin